MRDITRSRMAAQVKSRRATKAELREAQNRIKEIDAELRQIEVLPETKQGEEREARYQRMLRLRQMRDEFESRFPVREEPQPNSLMLAVVMTIGSFLICAFCAGGFYFAFTALNFNPGPTSVATSFWTDAKSQSYQDIYLNLLASNLRLQFVQTQFVSDAQQADSDYGPITNAVLTNQPTDGKSPETLTYTVTRQKSGGKAITYTVKLVMTETNNSWSITDMGAAIYPTEAGVTPVNSATPSTSATPSASATTGP
ncbi:MAG TPA: hypothetical protein VF812_18095 [Ktedonobacterales bacterium]